MDGLALAALSSRFSATATSLFSHPSHLSDPSHALDAETLSIRSLLALLAKGGLRPQAEAAARILVGELFTRHTDNLDEAEIMLTRALALTSKLNRQDQIHADIHFRATDALCAVYEQRGDTKAAATLVKDAAGEAETMGFPQWNLHFRLATFRVFGRVDAVKALAALAEAADAAEKKNQWEACALLLALHAHASLPHSIPSSLSSIIRLVPLLTPPSMSSTPPLAPTTVRPAIPPPPPPPNPASGASGAPGARVDNQDIATYVALVVAMVAVAVDKPVDAGDWLTGVRRRVDSAGSGGEDGVVTVHFQPASNTATPPTLRFQILPPALLSPLFFLLFALSHRGSDPGRAKRHLESCLKKIDEARARSHTSPSPTLPWPSYLFSLNCRALHLLYSVTLDRLELPASLSALNTLSTFVSSVPDAASQWEPALLLSMGNWCQAAGRVKEAIGWLEGAVGAVGDGGDAMGLEVKVGALVGIVLIRAGLGEARDLGAALRALSLLRDTVANHPRPDEVQDSHRAAVALAEGLVADAEGGKVQKAKAHLTEALKRSDARVQVKSLALGVLGSVFVDLDAVKAERMLYTAHSLARKTRSEILATAIAGPLAELSRQGGRDADAKTAEVEGEKSLSEVTKRWEAVSGMEL